MITDCISLRIVAKALAMPKSFCSANFSTLVAVSYTFVVMAVKKDGQLQQTLITEKTEMEK